MFSGNGVGHPLSLFKFLNPATPGVVHVDWTLVS